MGELATGVAEERNARRRVLWAKGAQRRRFLTLLIVLRCAAWLGCYPSVAHAEWELPSVINPQTYQSPGKYKLLLNPTDRYGRGPAHYQLLANGIKQWHKILPFTLLDAGVTANGTVAGYSYNHSATGSGLDTQSRGAGTLDIMILDNRGHIRLRRSIVRDYGTAMGSPPYPLVQGLIVDGATDHLLVRAEVLEPRLSDSSHEVWWLYRLSTGQSLGHFSPTALLTLAAPAMAAKAPDSPTSYIVAARLVPGTPLILAQFWLVDNMGSQGTLFCLVKLQDQLKEAQPAQRATAKAHTGTAHRGRQEKRRPTLQTGIKASLLWSLYLPHDYDPPAKQGDKNNNPSISEATHEALISSLRDTGAILPTTHPGQFALHLVSRNQRVTFAVTRAPHQQWQVHEAQRQSYPSPQQTAHAAHAAQLAKAEAWARVPLRSLNYKGYTQLPVSPAGASVRYVENFTVAAPHRLAFIRSLPERPDALVVVDDNGRVQQQQALSSLMQPSDPQGCCSIWSGLTWLGGTRYVVTQSSNNSDGIAKAWIVDIATHRINPVNGFRATMIKRVAAFQDGGFVLLGIRSEKYTMTDFMSTFTAQGQLLRTLEDDGEVSPASLFSPEDLCVTRDNQIAVLDNIRHGIQIYDREGHYQQTIDLAKAWHREPNYPSEIMADPQGGFVVNDFNGQPPIVRMTAQGTVEAQFQPRYRDGRTFYIRDGVQIATNGSLWTSDGYAMLRLQVKRKLPGKLPGQAQVILGRVTNNQDGIVDRAIGTAPQVAHLGQISDLLIDQKKRIYALDDRTHAVHVFDRQGHRLYFCQPLPTDFDEDNGSPTLSISSHGEAFVGPSRAGGMVRFSTSGQRLGVITFDRSSCSDKTNRRSRSRYHRSNVTVRRRRHLTLPQDLHWENGTLVDAHGTIMRQIERRADGTWMEMVETVSVAPHGEVAILDHKQSLASDSPQFISLYTRSGKPLRTIAITPWQGNVHHLSYDGQHLIIVTDQKIMALGVTGSTAGQTLWQFTPPKMSHASAWWLAFIEDRGHTLSLFDGEHKVYRYIL